MVRQVRDASRLTDLRQVIAQEKDRGRRLTVEDRYRPRTAPIRARRVTVRRPRLSPGQVDGGGKLTIAVIA
jgi:hypothetical protein